MLRSLMQLEVEGLLRAVDSTNVCLHCLPQYFPYFRVYSGGKEAIKGEYYSWYIMNKPPISFILQFQSNEGADYFGPHNNK